MRDVVIASSVRTAVGKSGKGTLRATRPDDLAAVAIKGALRSEEHTSELQSLRHLVCRLLLEKKKNKQTRRYTSIPSRTHTQARKNTKARKHDKKEEYNYKSTTYRYSNAQVKRE